MKEWYARIKYHRQAIPTEYGFDSKELADSFAKQKEQSNPYVRWTEVDQKRQYPKRALGNA